MIRPIGRNRDRVRPRLNRPLPPGVVPSFFTLMNLFCGFLSIVQVSQGNMVYGAWLIILAGVFDALDGFMARLTSSSGSFGMELDSLSDVVSFGVAPGFLLYHFGLNQLAFPGTILAALPALCGAIRLARFNVETKVEESPLYFRGMPIPVQAGMIVSFFLFFHDVPEWFDGFKYGIFQILVPMVLALSILMVGSVPFDKLPRFKKGVPVDRYRVYWSVISITIIIVFRETGLILAFAFYILKGLVMGFLRFRRDYLSASD